MNFRRWWYDLIVLYIWKSWMEVYENRGLNYLFSIDPYQALASLGTIEITWHLWHPWQLSQLWHCRGVASLLGILAITRVKCPWEQNTGIIINYAVSRAILEATNSFLYTRDRLVKLHQYCLPELRSRSFECQNWIEPAFRRAPQYWTEMNRYSRLYGIDSHLPSIRHISSDRKIASKMLISKRHQSPTWTYAIDRLFYCKRFLRPWFIETGHFPV